MGQTRPIDRRGGGVASATFSAMDSSPNVITVIALLLFAVIGYLWMALATAAVLRKAGEETWPAWVPVFNGMTLFRLAGYSQYWGLLFLVTPLVPFLWLVLSLRLNPAFGLSAGWAALAFFFPLIWLSVIGWGSASWHGLDTDEDPFAGLGGYARSSDPNPAWPGTPAGQPQYGAGGFDAPQYARPSTPAPLAEPNLDPYAPADTTALVTPGAAPFDPWNPTPVTPAAPAAAAAPVADAGAPSWESPAGWGAPVAPVAPVAPHADVNPPAPGVPAPAQPTGVPAPSWQAPEAASAPAWGAPAPAAPAPTAADAGSGDAPLPNSWGAPANGSSDVWAAPAPTSAGAPAAAEPVAPAAADVPADVAPSAESASVGAAGSPFAPPVQPLERDSSFAPGAGVVPAAAPAGEDSQPRGPRRATRMHDDSEVVAQARAARSTVDDEIDDTPDHTSAPATDLSEETDVPPIIVPASLGGGAVPPPPLPLSVREAADADSESVADSGWRPTLRRPHLPDDVESSIGMSAEVSAVAGAPIAGTPRSAMSTVSAQQGTTGMPGEEDEDFDHTELSSRHRTSWLLELPLSARPVEVTGTVVLLGRKPTADAEHPDAQLIPVADGTRTVSKTHARLELVRGQWKITDLGSTNGVVLFGADGTETEIEANTPSVVTERFLLGDAELRISERPSS